ncbi:MAG: argininosuccinate lyase, partial [Candidatus Helarchaeota archaeon]
MHLARSRNDQILTDLRLFMRDEILNVQKCLIKLITVLIETAEPNIETLFIGYTHTQQAQPITFAHWCMAHVDTFFRDLERLSQTYGRINTNPLGAAAIAGTSWPIDRDYTRELLGFDIIQENTLDVVSSRGEFTADITSVFASIMIHLARIAEDLILNSTSEFGVITLSDKYSTGSSIMPQKKNPDVLEVIRAKCGVIIGNLQKVLSILKSLPSGYNRDHQELKEALFPSIQTVKISIQVLTGLISTMTINQSVIEERLENSLLLATELVDLLVKRWDIPFRMAYSIIAQYIKAHPEDLKFDPEAVAEFINTYKDPAAETISVAHIKGALDPLETIKRRTHIGGPAPQEVQRMIQDRKQNLEKVKGIVLNLENKINEVFSKLLELVDIKVAE